MSSYEYSIQFRCCLASLMSPSYTSLLSLHCISIAIIYSHTKSPHIHTSSMSAEATGSSDVQMGGTEDYTQPAETTYWEITYQTLDPGTTIVGKTTDPDIARICYKKLYVVKECSGNIEEIKNRDNKANWGGRWKNQSITTHSKSLLREQSLIHGRTYLVSHGQNCHGRVIPPGLLST
jgi:hypothetical protein